MSREILFKAKRIDNGEWVEGDLVRSYLKIGNPCITDFAKGIVYGVDKDTICQCTGLKDKNGKLIWENDIVRFQFDNDDCPFPNKDIKKRIGKVFFSDFRASWSIAMGRNGSKCLNNDLFKYVQNGNRVEIIGNIFDNPELLKGSEESEPTENKEADTK